MSDDDQKGVLETHVFTVEQMKVFQELKPLLYKFMSVNKVKLTDVIDRRTKVLEALCNNKIKKGRFFCPCKFVPIGMESSGKYNCPCNTAMLEIHKRGSCTCGLFVEIKL